MRTIGTVIQLQLCFAYALAYYRGLAISALQEDCQANIAAATARAARMIGVSSDMSDDSKDYGFRINCNAVISGPPTKQVS